jgi:hypothetical protein
MGVVRSVLCALGLLMINPAGAHPTDRWTGIVVEASARFGLPIDWIMRVITVESGGQTMHKGRPIRSRAGAMGLMQLMPATWAAMRDRYDLGADPDEPRANIMAGTAYLRLMYDRFGYPGLFAAYNAGPGRTALALSGSRTLPAETQNYLALVAGRQIIPESIPSAAPDTLFAVRVRSETTVTPASPSPQRSTLFVDLSPDDAARAGNFSR